MGVNLWGVINGVKIFTPIMLSQKVDSYIVNTASGAGLVCYHPFSCYHVTKHAVVALSENLYVSLAERNAPVKVSVLCPAFVKTKIATSERNKPSALQDGLSVVNPAMQAQNESIELGMPPEEVARHVFRAMREEQFYILTHPEVKGPMRDRMEDLLEERNPRNPFAATARP